ncbi:hypothetical protein NDU88_008983 [Pleurodeles waltl]|uniref:Secreted protein n=1 Tax=Pleurodeles waltl TaxID=8319 RepID=A0AAV7QWC8_PLEWA|nr:hypothetical protein NDU88_008983 [Pleurodeles waltl]
MRCSVQSSLVAWRSKRSFMWSVRMVCASKRVAMALKPACSSAIIAVVPSNGGADAVSMVGSSPGGVSESRLRGVIGVEGELLLFGVSVPHCDVDCRLHAGGRIGGGTRAWLASTGIGFVDPKKAE